MLYNEILEAGQYISIFSDIIFTKNFQKIVLLDEPAGSSFIYKNNHVDYRLQEWHCNELTPHTSGRYESIYYFCLGIAIPPMMTTPYITYTTGSTTASSYRMTYAIHT